VAPSDRDALDRARAALGAGRDAVALEEYEYFFDHALDSDRALYGVRLSYCLGEWAKLGERYPPALRRLRSKARKALAALDETRDPERFHDFVAICRYLGREREPIRRFLTYHAKDRRIARTIVRFVWDQLVQAEHWAVCGQYVPKPRGAYQAIVTKFHQAMRICIDDPSLGGERFARQIKGSFVRDVSNLLSVLNKTGRRRVAASIRASVSADLKTRGCAELEREIDARVAG
jgi:hypothetical protein